MPNCESYYETMLEVDSTYMTWGTIYRCAVKGKEHGKEEKFEYEFKGPQPVYFADFVDKPPSGIFFFLFFFTFL